MPMPSPDSSSSEPPSVVLVTGSLEVGGAQRVLSDMGNYWARDGWRVTFATWAGKESEDFYPLAPNIRRVWLDVPSPNDSVLAKLRTNIKRVLALRRLLLEAKPSAVLSFIDISNVLTIVAAFGLNVRVVVAERTNPSMNHNVTRFWRTLRQILYSRADAVVAQTRDAALWIEKKCRTKVTVIPNPLRALPEISCQREPLIIAVGRLSKEKGFDLLLEAFARISLQFEEWRVVILGDGPERLALGVLRDRLNLAGRVEFLGQVQEPESWMARAGLVVHPSRREGFPNVVLEAMGMGAAVICTDCRSGPSELIRHDINGYLVPVDEPAELARAMAELMAKPGLRTRLAQEAERVRQQYEQGAIMGRWERVLTPLAAPTNRG